MGNFQNPQSFRVIDVDAEESGVL
ncbi:hypothetical protein AGR13a_Lc30112 [Agrobacterium genomosp. 13 str. CFBP 6927]|uniref:Uncharacterized protein n=1 Tax=Agrobacterium genomosp. 13 str. CFBP 6927 TaxID=1183428 RepID=A0ABM9VLR9_9HYPH|nr:hypothetical protein AGR13a_Lc30112 [Agrobacterium genomosp. 13 str. CFBP 6927]